MEPSTLKKFAADYSGADPWRTISMNPQRVPADVSLQQTLVRQNQRTKIYLLKNKSTAQRSTCGGSAADFGGVRSRSAQVHGKSTPGVSTRGPLEVRADTSGSMAEQRQTKVRPINSPTLTGRMVAALFIDMPPILQSAMIFAFLPIIWNTPLTAKTCFAKIGLNTFSVGCELSTIELYA